MKKGIKHLLFVIAIIAVGVMSSNAQELGVRFGGNLGGPGVAVDGVFGAGDGRIHADLGFWDGGFGIDALWDFVYKPLGGGRLNWYLGAGPTTIIGDNFWLGVSGEAGLEYRFDKLPIVLGVDWRPTFWIIEDTEFGADTYGFNVRWVFGARK